MCLFSDIDECAYNRGGCQYKCINVHGGYRCDCPREQRLHADGRTCIGKYQCKSRFRICIAHNGLAFIPDFIARDISLYVD